MDKKVETISFWIENHQFNGAINMRRDKHAEFNGKTTFYGHCSSGLRPHGVTFTASGSNIDDVRMDLYLQADGLYGIKNWEPWLLIKVYEQEDIPRPTHPERGLMHPHRESITLKIDVERYRRAESKNGEIWSNYYRVIQRPIVENAKEPGERAFSEKDYFKGALIPDDGCARDFILYLRKSVAEAERRAMDFLCQDNIQKTIASIGSGSLPLLEA